MLSWISRKSQEHKINKAIVLLCKLHHNLPRSLLLTIFLNPLLYYLEYGDFIYDRKVNATLQQKLESTALAMADAIRRISKEKLNNELDLETLETIRLYMKLECFCKIFRYHCPKYLFNTIPNSASTCNTRNTNNILVFKVEQNFCQNSFLRTPVIR